MIGYGAPHFSVSAIETGYSRWISQQIEAGRRWVAQWRGEEYRPLPPRTGEFNGSTLAEAIRRGHERIRQALE
jgi:hypothetical protein